MHIVYFATQVLEHQSAALLRNVHREALKDKLKEGPLVDGVYPDNSEPEEEEQSHHVTEPARAGKVTWLTTVSVGAAFSHSDWDAETMSILATDATAKADRNSRGVLGKRGAVEEAYNQSFAFEKGDNVRKKARQLNLAKGSARKMEHMSNEAMRTRSRKS